MKNIVSFFLIFVSLTCYSKTERQEFEGIVYYTKFMSKLNNSDATKKHEKFLKDRLGEKSVFYYKNGKHLWDRTETGGKELYLKNSKYLYVKKDKNYDVWRTSLVSKSNEVIQSIKLLNETDTVLGINCHILEVKSTFFPVTKGRKWLRKFYFNKDQFFINYKYLKKYKVNSQDIIYKMMQSIPLRIYVEINGVALDYIATSFENKKIDDSIFSLPSKVN